VQSSNVVSLALNTVYIPLFLILLKLLRYRLIWTAHNLLPHERTSLNDRLLMKMLLLLSDKVIVHSDIQLPTNKKIIIPHGNYINFYPNVVTKHEARKKLDVQQNDFVFLFFGHIKPYKGVELLLNSFQKIQKTNMKLLIVGDCKDPQYLDLLNKKTDKLTNVTIIQSFIASDEVQYYFNAADTVVLPFKEVTTSGSFILASSFKKTVIAPCIGMFATLPQNLGYFYSLSNEDVLSSAMLQSFLQRKRLPAKGKLSYDYVSKFKWSEIASQTIKTYLRDTKKPEKKPPTEAVTKWY
jgi:glycosyltransferase involved in cell wall biosynthesis